MKKVLILFLSVTVFLTACGTADEKVKGKWVYKYDKFQNLTFSSDKERMYVEAKGVQVEVKPLKDATSNEFKFLLDSKKQNYVYNVKIDDEEHIVITPEPEDKTSLPERLVGTDNINDKTKKVRSITLKKVD
ncbi:hypothetical protein KYJ98_08375 [Mammaliicoccus lentus]|uniref:hypothetical protein n=1 Tax=Mammaliicoccus lentus TaxID=42858 RepID=UPI001C4DE48D|nr:hypothetical protein [Mammaliicoccus lentus]MBW0770361.1 hypothetical protein [Mammaliicoccus lentus]